MGLTINRRIRINGTYKNEDIKINSLQECLSYVNLHVNEKYISFNDDVTLFINNAILNNTQISYKKFHRKIKELTGGKKSKFQLLFWTNRGYSEDDANEMIRIIQKSNSNKFLNKKKLNPELYKSYNTTQIGYWIKKGYTEDEAKALVKQRQTTFTLQKCMIKYGEEEGIKIYNKRNEQWINSRNKSLKNGNWSLIDQGNSFNTYIQKYGETWLIHFIKYLRNKKCKESYINICESANIHKDDLLNYVLGLTYDIAKFYFICGPINFILNKNSIELKELWCKHNNVKFISTRYGNVSYINGNYYQSTGEYEIGMFLEEKKIKFDVHVQYPKSNRLCDFYLYDYDIYIEYTGMNGKNYDDKKKELKDFNIIWSKDINFIKNEINEKICRN